MVTQLTLKEVLGKAIRKEIGAQRLYTDLSHKIKDQAARDALQELARQELGHQNLLEKYERGEFKKGALSSEHTVDYKIVEQSYQPEISPNMKLPDIFLLAASR